MFVMYVEREIIIHIGYMPRIINLIPYMPRIINLISYVSECVRESI